MSEAIETAPLNGRRKKPVEPMWWDTWLTHPLSDEEFFEVYAAHLFTTTPDRDVVRVRNRVFDFMRNFMRPQWEQALAAYRQEHPL